ncbi:hypothetical protein [Paeniglutamicibacter cryotolerans]|uniref:Uncharacterized membrane protein YdcZ (DUF606 family) n=1 Tax=Paeniglutamicibacter cryotolerans TaxID=670079 RepID=A0A839QPY0_9MICC|nr:hypothetical protein [Paeniglutamicibacter cryotolerans]MBB2996814.1 uncharacterized membrane protein YdcZ (DUF606 family) [Paeniglutamicibacter cryotolerans]
MNIQWIDFLIVAATTLVSALFIVGAYSLGVRMLAVAEDEGRSRAGARAAAFACFGLCGIVVVFGIILIVPSLSAKILGA